MTQEIFKSLEVYDIIFSMAEHVNKIFDLDSLSLYKYVLTNQGYIVEPYLTDFVNDDWRNHFTTHQNIFVHLIDLWQLPKTSDNLKKVVQCCIVLRSANCMIYSIVMCSILSKLLPKKYSDTLIINTAQQDDHVVLFLHINERLFVIDLWARNIIKNKFGLICNYTDYIKNCSEVKIMKHFDFLPHHEITKQSKQLDLRYLLKI